MLSVFDLNHGLNKFSKLLNIKIYYVLMIAMPLLKFNSTVLLLALCFKTGIIYMYVLILIRLI